MMMTTLLMSENFYICIGAHISFAYTYVYTYMYVELKMKKCICNRNLETVVCECL